ncbi:MAG TPA: AMP-binding protein, partial [Gammaproteobacteria bacterium]|nr:AMP-binding protein [Gammaproteobacteria bacterium]
MEKIWLKNYPPGVPAEINPDAYQSLVEIFEKSCLHYPDHAALYGLGTTLTYQQLDELSRDFAAYLQNKLNLVKGDRIAIMLPNILQYPIALFGALRAGLVIVNVNPLYTADEVAHQLHDAEASAIIVLANFANTLEKAL